MSEIPTADAARLGSRPPRLLSLFSKLCTWAPSLNVKLVAPDCAQHWGVLMAAAQRGDSVAYVVLLHEIARWVRALSSDQCGKEISEDTVRASLLRIHWARFTYDHRRPFGPWISAVVGYSLRRPAIRRSTGFWRHGTDRLTAVRRRQAF